MSRPTLTGWRPSPFAHLNLKLEIAVSLRLKVAVLVLQSYDRLEPLLSHLLLDRLAAYQWKHVL